MPEIPGLDRDLVAEALDAASERKETRRAYLGASVIGEKCERRLWYAFRWAHPPEPFEPRMQRLFETGHVYEERLLVLCRKAGMDVASTQEAVSALGGHFRGHMDGMATGVPGASKALHVIETKTANEKAFRQISKDGVRVARPLHFAQMQVYMHLASAPRALYIVVNKNDDAIHTERIRYDPVVADGLIEKARRIIESDTPPPRVSDDPGGYPCRYCPALEICHGPTLAHLKDANCRTCLHATARTDDGTWRCARWGDLELDEERQRVGCEAHLWLPGLVPGKVIDVADDWVLYVLEDGTEWRDGG